MYRASLCLCLKLHYVKNERRKKEVVPDNGGQLNLVCGVQKIEKLQYTNKAKCVFQKLYSRPSGQTSGFIGTFFFCSSSKNTVRSVDCQTCEL